MVVKGAPIIFETCIDNLVALPVIHSSSFCRAFDGSFKSDNNRQDCLYNLGGQALASLVSRGMIERDCDEKRFGGPLSEPEGCGFSEI